MVQLLLFQIDPRLQGLTPDIPFAIMTFTGQRYYTIALIGSDVEATNKHCLIHDLLSMCSVLQDCDQH